MKRYFNGTIVFLAALFVFGTVAQAGVISITHPSYGAIGNGSYDNTAAIQNALAAAAANDTVHIPAGIYNVNDTLVVPSGVRVQGVGSLFNCQIRLVTTNRPLFRVADGSSGVIFKDVTLSTNAADYDAQTIRDAGTTGIALLATNGISGTVIENVRVWEKR